METPLKELLSRYTREGLLYEVMPHGWVRCFACGHRCKIAPGREGICKVRFNDGGTLRVPFGYVAGMAIDPIEKKPFYHVLPGSTALSFGMLGCDYHCAYCQNWITSQALRDPSALAGVDPISARQIVESALRRNIPIITSTYNEPLITSEWAVEVFRLARPEGILCSYVSNGNGTTEVLDYLRPTIDLYKVDLKSFRQKNYQQLGGRLQAVLDTIAALHSMKVWTEVVTLVVPGFNDSDDELTEIAHFLASVSVDIPWHVTAFHQDYKMTDPDPTPVRTLVRARDIGKRAGLHFVYAGNIPGRIAGGENTTCPSCAEVLVERSGFAILQNRLIEGVCPTCQTSIAGVWLQKPRPMR